MEMLFDMLDRYAKDRQSSRAWDIVGISEAQWYVYKKKRELSQKHLRTLSLYFGCDVNDGVKRLTATILKKYWEVV